VGERGFSGKEWRRIFLIKGGSSRFLWAKEAAFLGGGTRKNKKRIRCFS